MHVIVAHESTCDIVVNGPTVDMDRGPNKMSFSDYARPCTCGGRFIKVEWLEHES